MKIPLSTSNPRDLLSVSLRGLVSGTKKNAPSSQKALTATLVISKTGRTNDSSRSEPASTDGMPLCQAGHTRLMQRIRALSEEEARQPRKVFYLFLESVLIQEFDGDMQSPAEWASLAESVMAQMESDVELQQAIHDAGRLLVTAATTNFNHLLSTDSTVEGAPQQMEAQITGLNPIQ